MKAKEYVAMWHETFDGFKADKASEDTCIVQATKRVLLAMFKELVEVIRVRKIAREKSLIACVLECHDKWRAVHSKISPDVSFHAFAKLFVLVAPEFCSGLRPACRQDKRLGSIFTKAGIDLWTLKVSASASHQANISAASMETDTVTTAAIKTE